MSQRRGTRRGTRTRRTRRRATVLDLLMVAGIVGGGVYLLLTYLLAVPVPVATGAGLIGAGFYVGTTVRTPRFRSPITWRRPR